MWRGLQRNAMRPAERGITAWLRQLPNLRHTRRDGRDRSVDPANLDCALCIWLRPYVRHDWSLHNLRRNSRRNPSECNLTWARRKRPVSRKWWRSSLFRRHNREDVPKCGRLHANRLWPKHSRRWRSSSRRWDSGKYPAKSGWPCPNWLWPDIWPGWRNFERKTACPCHRLGAESNGFWNGPRVCAIGRNWRFWKWDECARPANCNFYFLIGNSPNSYSWRILIGSSKSISSNWPITKHYACLNISTV